MTHSLVSITMGSYNGGKFIDEQIQSLINQTYENFEIVINDDCSTDDTWQKLESWRDAYPGIISIYRNDINLGWMKNFDVVFQLAKGKYIAYCDQDDIWDIHKLEIVIPILEADNDIVMVHHSGHSFGAPMKCPDYLSSKGKNIFYYDPFEGNDPCCIFWHSRVLGHKMVFRKELLQFIIPSRSMTYDWFIAVGAAAMGKVVHIWDDLVAHRNHNEPYKEVFNFSISHAQRIQYYKDLLQFTDLYKKEDLYILQKLIRNLELKKQFSWPLFFFVLRYRYKLLRLLRGGNIFTREIFRWRTARAWAKNW